MDLHRGYQTQANICLFDLGKKINTKILHQKLNSLNGLACLLTTNLTRATPQMSLEIILYIEPLYIHIKKLGLIAYKRLESKVTWCTDPTKSHFFC